MSGTITDINGKTYKMEDIGSVTWVDYKGDPIFKSDYGDTVEYVQNGVKKTKKLTESRRLLQFMDGFAAGDYSYMPKTTGDVVQATALDMMTDSAGWVLAKGAMTLVGGALGTLGGNPLFGASIGTMVANMGADIYSFIDAYTDSPNEFWSKYVQNLRDVSRGADSDLEPNATGWQRWLSEINTGMSYTGMGGKAAVYQTWDDIIGATPNYVSANVIGNLTRSIASSLTSKFGAISPTYVIDQALNDGIREASRVEGITNDMIEAAKMAAVYGSVSAATAGLFAKIPLAETAIFKKMKDVSPFLGNPLANGIEAVAAQGAYDFIQNVADDTEESRPLIDYGVNAGMAFALGFTMSALPTMWSKIRPEEVAKETKVPKSPDTPEVKEAVESRVKVEGGTKPETEVKAESIIETPAAAEEIKTEIKVVKPELAHGKVQNFSPEQAEKIRQLQTGREYLEAAHIAERDLLQNIDPKQDINAIKEVAFKNIFDGLDEDRQRSFLNHLGWTSPDLEAAKFDFKRYTTLKDMLSWASNKADIFDIPIYNPIMPAITAQQENNIIADATRLVNNGMTLDTAIYQSYCKNTRVAPDSNEMAKMIGKMPEPIKNFSRNSWDMTEVEDFMRKNLVAPKPKKEPKPKPEPKPKKVSDTDMKKLLGAGDKSFVKDNLVVAEGEKFVMQNDKSFEISENITRQKTQALEGTEETIVNKWTENLYEAREKRINNVEVGNDVIFGKNEYRELKIDGKKKYVLTKWWNFLKKQMGKDFDVWTVEGEPDKVYFSKGNKIGCIELEKTRSKFNEKSR